MDAILNADWTADVVGRMHKYKISNTELAEECGYTAAYLSMVLNGHKAVGNTDTRDSILRGLEAVESKRMIDPAEDDGCAEYED